MKKRSSKEVVEELVKSGFIYLYLVSLISSDTLLSAKDCEKSLKEIEFFESGLEEADIPEDTKAELQERVKTGKEIIIKDLENFKKDDN